MAKGVGDVLYSILSNDTNISAIVGTKIYPFLAIEDVVYPYIVYTIEGVDPTQTDDGVSILDVNSANIEIYSEDLSENETLSKYVRNALDRYKGTVEGIEVQSISFRSEGGGYADADRVYLKIQDYSLRMVTVSCMFSRVTDLAAASISASQIDLTWTDVATGETGWEIWRSQDFINWTLVDTIAADSTSYSNTGLTGGTSYSYKIRAIDSTDKGEWSNIVIGCTETTPEPPNEWLEIEVDTTIVGETASDSIKIGFYNNSFLEVDWESDGNIEYVNYVGITTVGSHTHQYSTGGVYTIRIKGTGDIYMDSTDDKLKFTEFKNCGTCYTHKQGTAFRGCSNMVVSATDVMRVQEQNLNLFHSCSLLVTPPKLTVNATTSYQSAFRSTSLNADLGYMDMRYVGSLNGFATSVTTWSQDNYEATWVGWMRWDSNTGTPDANYISRVFNGVPMNGGNSTVGIGSDGAAARAYAINTLGWVVTDGGEV